MRAKPSNPSPPFSGTSFRRPTGGTFREAWGLFVFSAMFAVLFNLFYAYGIELKPAPEKKTSVQEMAKGSPTPSADLPGWKKTSKDRPAKKNTPPPSIGDGFPRLSINGVKDRFEKGDCVFLDARKPEEYAEGHIPGALNLYANELEKYIPLVVPQLPDRNKQIVAYCHGGDCDLSLQAAKALKEAGYDHVVIFEGGWPDWKKSGLPIHTGVTP